MTCSLLGPCLIDPLDARWDLGSWFFFLDLAVDMDPALHAGSLACWLHVTVHQIVLGRKELSLCLMSEG